MDGVEGPESHVRADASDRLSRELVHRVVVEPPPPSLGEALDDFVRAGTTATHRNAFSSS